MSDYTLIPSRFANVTPSDTTVLSATLYLHIGGAGTVVVIGSDGSSSTFTAIAGAVLKGRFVKVMAASTATNIVAAFER